MLVLFSRPRPTTTPSHSHADILPSSSARRASQAASVQNSVSKAFMLKK
jgi:hypothetical protein